MNLVRPAGRAPFLAGVFLICMCGLVMQIVQTRILSVIAFYHLAFFAISMAMLGMTAGSLFVYFRAPLFPRERLLESLTWICSAFSVVTVVSAVFLTSMIVTPDMRFGLSMILWAKLILVILPPYFLAGMAVSLALTRSPWRVGLVYSVDLLGAATGCLVVLALLWVCDAISALIAVSALGALAGACFARARRTHGAPEPQPMAMARLLVLRYPLVLAGLFAGLAAANSAVQPRGLGPIFVKGRLEFAVPAVQAWNSFSRIRVTQDEVGAPYMGGASPRMPELRVHQRLLSIDGEAATALYRFDIDLNQVAFLNYDITNLAYAIRHAGRAAIIGVGGGRDVLAAYLAGFTDVTGIEINPIIVDILRNRLHEYNRIASLPGLRLVIDEARSWFARTRERFDLIEMSLIDTWAATGAGAFSLSENGLYTVEAWRNFLNALAPDGVFTVSRWYTPDNPAETSRLVSLAVAALRARGVAQPEAHIFLAGSRNLATLIVATTPLSASDLARLRARCAELAFTILLDPGVTSATPLLDAAVRAQGPRDLVPLMREYHADLTAPTDDRPFFFNQLLPTDLRSFQVAAALPEGVQHGNLEAAKTLVIIILLSAIGVVAAVIAPALPTVRQASPHLSVIGSAYFLLIGLGFMFVEIGIIQRASLYLGHPVYGLAIGLFGIIVATGVGSLVSERWALDTPTRLAAWACLLTLFIALLSVWFPLLVGAFEGYGLAVRVPVVLAAIVPSGLLMGFGFPTGLRLVERIDARSTPWFWAVNGAAGVLAASLAVATSISFSINVSLWLGAACYLLLAPVAMALCRMSAPAIGGADASTA